MFKNETKTRMMAMAIVAMFMLTAFSIALVDKGADAAEHNDASYTINMKVGDTFTYSPTSNLDNTTFSWTRSSGDDLTTGENVFSPASGVNGTTFTFTPAAAGDMVVTLTAHWEAHELLVQNATQTLTFHVVERMTFRQSASTGGTSATVTDSSSAAFATAAVSLTEGLSSAQTYTFAVSGGTNAVFSAAPTIKKGNDTSTAITTSDHGSSTITVTVPKTIKEGTYTVTMPAYFTIDGTSGESTTATQTKNLTFTITVAQGMSIRENGPLYTVIGDSTYDDFTFTMDNTSGVTTSSIAWDLDATADSNWATTGDGQNYVEASSESTSNDKLTYTITLPTDSTYNNSLIGSANQSATVTFTVSATATGNGSGTVGTSKDFVLNVYRDLKFTSTPVMSGENVKVFNNSANGLDVLLTANVQGAKKVVYNWGDGKTNTQDIVSGVENYLSLSHSYDRAGTYFIQITASNDFGDTTVITPYTTGDAVSFPEIPSYEITILDGKDTSRVVGEITVKEGSAFRISQITIPSDSQAYMEKKKIIALYTEAANSDGVFDATKKWNQGQTVQSNSPTTLYAEIQPTTQADDFFAEHGWLFIVFAILTILGLIAIFYLGFQAPQFYAIAVVLLVLTVLLFLYKDFGGIWDAITGLFH